MLKRNYSNKKVQLSKKEINDTKNFMIWPSENFKCDKVHMHIVTIIKNAITGENMLNQLKEFTANRCCCESYNME